MNPSLEQYREVGTKERLTGRAACSIQTAFESLKCWLRMGEFA